MDTRSSKGKVLPMKSIKEASREEVRYIRQRKQGDIRSLKTPWRKFNIAGMDGIEWGTINVIAGMSGSGKTSILSSLEGELFEQNPHEDFAVLSFNFEMVARRLVGRKISSRMQKSVKQLYSADRMHPDKNISDEEIRQAINYLDRDIKDLPIYYSDIPGTVDDIRETIISFQQRPENRHRYILVTLDHSLLIRPTDGQSKEREVLAEFSIMMNELKKKINCSFVIISQLNREIETVDRKKNPSMHFPQKMDVFGGDSLFQFADIFLISHRPEQLNLESYGPYSWPVDNMIYWHFIKIRDGDPFIAKMMNDLGNNRIIEPSEEQKAQF